MKGIQLEYTLYSKNDYLLTTYFDLNSKIPFVIPGNCKLPPDFSLPSPDKNPYNKLLSVLYDLIRNGLAHQLISEEKVLKIISSANLALYSRSTRSSRRSCCE